MQTEVVVSKVEKTLRKRGVSEKISEVKVKEGMIDLRLTSYVEYPLPVTHHPPPTTHHPFNPT